MRTQAFWKRALSVLLCMAVVFGMTGMRVHAEEDTEPVLPESNSMEAVESTGVISGDYAYQDLEDGTIEITDYTGTDTDIEVPAVIDGKLVTRIGNSAFSYCRSLYSIVLPVDITGIGEDAFYCCSGLVSLEIPDSVTNIGQGAFKDCSGLTSIALPENLTSIGQYAFCGCSSLTSIMIPDGVTNIGERAFEFCGGLRSVYLPEGLKSIGEGAFSGCGSLTGIVIPDSVTTLGGSAFWGCNGLVNVTLSENITSIGEYTFVDCSSLTSITIPENVTSIGDGAFHSCSSLVSIVIPEGVTGIGQGTFSSCGSLVSATIPDSVTSIGQSAFDCCKSLRSITLPDSITAIGQAAFQYCSGLERINIPKKVTSISRECFDGCEKLKEILLPESVLGVGYRAFQDCDSLKKISIANANCMIYDEENTIALTAVIYGCEDSLAKEYAVKYDRTFVDRNTGEITCSHKYGEGKVIKNATCASEGVIQYTCVKCQTVVNEKIPKTAHIYQTIIKKATTSENGSVTKKCINGSEIASTTTIFYPKTVKLSKTNVTYNGKAQKPAVTVIDSNGKKISSSNYTISYKNNKNVGRATVTVRFKGNYSGTLTKTFDIIPKGTSISVISAKSKGIALKWKKQMTQTTGYQLQYSASSKFMGAKSITVGKNKTAAKNISKLSAKKKYYVRIRTYKKVKINGKSTNIYSGWSKAKFMTTKK